MNSLQKKLLDMMQEIDEICKAGGIEYYLSGGSVIGAIRHGGFIPWDDDIDLLMTRENWEKFKVFAPDRLPPHRELGCIERNHNFQNTIGRYSDTESTQIHKNELLGEDVAGIVIDIILLDRFDNTPENYAGYMKYLMLYSDLINKYYFYGMRLSYTLPYTKYLAWSIFAGRKKVLDHLLHKMLEFTSPQGDSYIVFWGGGPTVFPASVFQKPRYADFEGVSLPLPTGVSEFTRILYGDEWTEIPHVGMQFDHDCVFLPDVPYRDFFKIYLSRMNVKKATRDYIRYKIKVLRHSAYQNFISGKTLFLEGKLQQYSLEAAIEKNHLNVQAMYQSGAYHELNQLFSGYFEKQCSRNYLGGETWEALTRRFDPIYIPISDELLAIALNVLLIYGRMGKAARVLQVRQEKNRNPLTPELLEFQSLVSAIRSAIEDYINADYESALKQVEALIVRYPHIPHIKKMQVRLNRRVYPENRTRLDTLIAEGLALRPHDGDFIKEYAASLYEDLGISGSYEAFSRAFASTRNGIVRKEIQQIFRDNDAFFAKTFEALFQSGKYEETVDFMKKWRTVLEADLDIEKKEIRALLEVLGDAELRELGAKIRMYFREDPSDPDWPTLYGRLLERLNLSASYPYYRLLVITKAAPDDCALAEAKFREEEDLNTPEALMILGRLAKRQGEGAREFALYRTILRTNPDFEPVAQNVLSTFKSLLHQMCKRQTAANAAFYRQAFYSKFPNMGELFRWLLAYGLVEHHRHYEMEELLSSIYMGDSAKIQQLLTLLESNTLESEDDDENFELEFSSHKMQPGTSSDLVVEQTDDEEDPYSEEISNAEQGSNNPNAVDDDNSPSLENDRTRPAQTLNKEGGESHE